MNGHGDAALLTPQETARDGPSRPIFSALPPGDLSHQARPVLGIALQHRASVGGKSLAVVGCVPMLYRKAVCRGRQLADILL